MAESVLGNNQSTRFSEVRRAGEAMADMRELGVPDEVAENLALRGLEAKKVGDKIAVVSALPEVASFGAFKIYDSVEELVRDGFKFSAMNVGRGDGMSAEDEQAVRDEVRRLLGDRADVKIEAFAKAGAFAKISGVETLMIAKDAMVPLSVARHEAVHALMLRLVRANPRARGVLMRAAGSPAIVARLNVLLRDHPNALKQLTAAGINELRAAAGRPKLTDAEAEQRAAEERVAYMYQLWAADPRGSGLLNVGPETRSWFEQVKGFFLKVRALWADDITTQMAVEEAGQLIDLFHSGALADPSTVGQVIRDRMPADLRGKIDSYWPALGKFLDKFVFTSTMAVRDMNHPELTAIMDKFFRPVETAGGEPGFIQSNHVEYNRRFNKVMDAIRGLTRDQIDALPDELRAGPPTTEAGRKIRAVLDEAFGYMVQSGVRTTAYDPDTGRIVTAPLKPLANYFPRVANIEVLSTAAGKAAFIAVLRRFGVPDPEAVHANYVKGPNASDPADDLVIGLTFHTPQTNVRTLAHIPDSELAPFLSNDLIGIMSQYLARASRRAEYTRRFGNTGEKIREAKEAALESGLTAEQGRTFDEAVKALDGSLGSNISTGLKNLFGGITTYQNIRLLPLAIFSSMVDPMGIVVRGGTLGEAAGAFWRGLRNLVKENEDGAFDLAKTVGAINSAHDAAVMQDMYSSQFMPRTQQIVNDAFFRYNGMESWNRSMRTAASAAAEQFIIRHATRPNEHSERFLRELGLTAQSVRVVDGKLDLSDHRTVAAINTWVDQAILRPNSAMRPIYMSDPHWMLVSHLKQYMYLFQKTIIARVHHEMQHGNYSPAYALAGYVPMIIAADMMKILLTPGGGDDRFRKNWTAGDWLWSGVQRASLFGPGQMVMDSHQDLAYNKWGIESIAGPTAQQLLDFARATATGRGLTDELARAIPGERLIR